MDYWISSIHECNLVKLKQDNKQPLCTGPVSDA